MSTIRKNSRDLSPGGINERDGTFFSPEKSLWLDEEETTQYILFSLNMEFCSRTAVLGLYFFAYLSGMWFDLMGCQVSPRAAL